MQPNSYLYSFSYPDTESQLCKLESRYIFHQEEKNKGLLSDIKAEPSSSAFIKSRLDISSFSDDYSTLLDEIKKESIRMEGFKVEYLVFDGDTTVYEQRLEKLKDIGYSIDGYPNYYTPTLTYGIGFYLDTWYFGILLKNNHAWYKHKQKPCSYSNSIGINIAKALVNIAAKADKKTTLLDACCGVGTIMLEACFAGYTIEGSDINWKVCEHARENLGFFDYASSVYHTDIKDLNKRYDAAIIDLPYNLLSVASDEDILHILSSVAKITERMVIVSTADISTFIDAIGFSLIDFCSVNKLGNLKFSRKIWVCEKRSTGRLVDL